MRFYTNARLIGWFTVFMKFEYLHNLSQILKKNVELHSSSQNHNNSSGEKNIIGKQMWNLSDIFDLLYAGLAAEKLEWGNSGQICHILEKYSRGFDLILGADIYILIIIFSWNHFQAAHTNWKFLTLNKGCIWGLEIEWATNMF